MKKKILFYTSGLGLGGVERVIIELLKNINKDKFDIKLGLQYSNENLFIDEIPKEINYEFMLPQKIIDRSLYYRSKKKNFIYKILYSMMLGYEKYIIKKNYLKFSKDRDIVIDFKSGDFLKLISLNKTQKKICWIHGALENLNKWKKNANDFKKNIMECDKVICICDEMKDGFIKKIPKIEDKMQVIYNSFDFERINNLSCDLAEVNIEEKKLLSNNYLIMVSRIETKMKDFKTLFIAFKNVLKEKANIYLYILGDGPDRDQVQKLTSDLGILKNVIFLGTKKNPYPWIKNCQILIHSSKAEGLPTVLIEGLILNKLIISTACSTGPKDILEYGKYGSLVEVGDSTSMGNEILELLNEKSKKRNNYLAFGMERIIKFDKKYVIKKVEELLLKL